MAPESCPACAVDPLAAPGRYCAPARCLCGHAQCPAYATWQERHAWPACPFVPVVGVPAELAARTRAMADRAARARVATAAHPDLPDRYR